MSVNQNQIGNEHPADQAMQREHSPQPVGSTLTPEELAGYSTMNPPDLVTQLANQNVEVPRDSPLHRMSGDQLKAEMQKSMKAIADFRSVKQSVDRLEHQAANSNDMGRLLGRPAFDSAGNVILDGMGSEFERAERAAEQSRKSAAMAGLRDAEYNAAIQQLEQTAPNARPPATASGAPYEITKGTDGSYTIQIGTGEVFKGDADKVIRDLAHSKHKTSVWGHELKAQLKQLQNGQASPQSNQPQQFAPQQFQQPDPNQPPQPGWDSVGQLPDEGSRFLVENAAKVLGYNSADELINHQLQRDQKLAAVEQRLEAYETERLAMDFQGMCPDFPGTQQAADAVVAIIEASGLTYDVDNLALAHQHAVRKGLYQPLQAAEIEATYQPQGRQSSGRQVPPQPPGGNNPDGTQWQGDPWRMSQDELRRKVLDGGGLGKALLEMRAGETFGG